MHSMMYLFINKYSKSNSFKMPSFELCKKNTFQFFHIKFHTYNRIFQTRCEDCEFQ